jgi:CheY-like chemotaxis protein
MIGVRNRIEESDFLTRERAMFGSVRYLWEGERLSGACRDGGFEEQPDAVFSPRVLVVADIPTHRALLGGILRMIFPGVTVDEAENGRQAQDVLRKAHYDVVLSEWIMPEMDGVQLAAWLCSGEVPRRPVVLFSDCVDTDDVAALFIAHWIDGYLPRPFDRIAMHEVISVAVGNAPAAA